MIFAHKKAPLQAPFLTVGLRGIEPRLHEPESCVIPLYHSPWSLVSSGGLEGNRTPCLHNANVALYQMSYKPFTLAIVAEKTE